MILINVICVIRDITLMLECVNVNKVILCKECSDLNCLNCSSSECFECKTKFYVFNKVCISNFKLIKIILKGCIANCDTCNSNFTCLSC